MILQFAVYFNRYFVVTEIASLYRLAMTSGLATVKPFPYPVIASDSVAISLFAFPQN